MNEETKRRIAILAGVAGALGIAIGGAATAAPPSPELISRGPGEGVPGNGPSLFPTASADGALIAFRSEATNLVPDDTDAERDVFVRDRQSGQVTLVSRASGAAGVNGNRPSYNPRISADGRYVAFRSNATNLVPADADRLEDIYVRDLRTNETRLVSRASGSAGAKGNGGSFNPSISADGRYVAFRSESTNLAPEDTDAVPDIYVRDLQANVTTLVSRASGAAGPKGSGTSEFPVISGDGRRVAFRSESPNLHLDDTDTIEDIFLRDLETNETVLISRATGAGPKGNGRSTFVSLSADGTTIAFDSLSTNLHPDDTDASADVFARDLRTGSVDLVSRAPGAAGAKGGGSAEPSVSADGRYIAFHSVASNLDPDDPDEGLDVYLRDMETFATDALSTGVAEPPYARSYEPQMAANGKLVVFHSDAGAAPGGSAPPADVFAVETPKLEKCLGKRATLVAASGALTRGTRGDDVILGSDGSERIKSGRGDDRICAGGGNDTLIPGRGDDKLKAGDGADKVKGGGGRDRILGNGGKDRLKGSGGADRLKGGGGRDRLEGGGRDDILDGGSGRDRCDGGGGTNKLKRCERPRRDKSKRGRHA